MLLGFHPAFARILFRITLIHPVAAALTVSPFVPLFLDFLQHTGRMPASAPTTRWCSPYR
ncbi:hypothetical protein MJ575_13850 [Klebsiella pneumoniae]|nr:hypothetical protein MJ575_13850 [Klebsiella pneumoniae]